MCWSCISFYLLLISLFICLCAIALFFGGMTFDVTHFLCTQLSGFWLLAFLVQEGHDVLFGRKRFVRCYIYFVFPCFYILFNLSFSRKCILYTVYTCNYKNFFVGVFVNILSTLNCFLLAFSSNLLICFFIFFGQLCCMSHETLCLLGTQPNFVNIT